MTHSRRWVRREGTEQTWKGQDHRDKGQTSSPETREEGGESSREEEAQSQVPESEGQSQSQRDS